MAKPLLWIPPVLFAGIAGLFALGMFSTADDAPSAFIGKQAPPVPGEALDGTTLLTDADLRTGEVTLVNFWASWCAPCRLEHPTLLEFQEQGLRVAGINFGDTEGQALRYLEQYEDPFFAGAFDPTRRGSLEWGVTAPPETFIVAGDGTVLFRYQGPLLEADFENRFMPALREALASGQ